MRKQIRVLALTTAITVILSAWAEEEETQGTTAIKDEQQPN